MHNCKLTRERLAESLLDGILSIPRDVLNCESCRKEFEAVKETLVISDQVIDATLPQESYWVGYHARLRSRLNDVETEVSKPWPRSQGHLKWFASTIRVPVPIAAAVLIVLALSLFTAIRSSRQPQSSPAVSLVEIPVEVPVVKEKVVTRIVYKRSPRVGPRVSPPETSAIAKSQKPGELRGFKPLEEIKLTVIKGGGPDDK